MLLDYFSQNQILEKWIKSKNKSLFIILGTLIGVDFFFCFNHEQYFLISLSLTHFYILSSLKQQTILFHETQIFILHTLVWGNHATAVLYSITSTMRQSQHSYQPVLSFVLPVYLSPAIFMQAPEPVWKPFRPRKYFQTFPFGTYYNNSTFYIRIGKILAVLSPTRNWNSMLT